jgi:hypothetical protein
MIYHCNMHRAIIAVVLCLLSIPARAHLNHIQFASIDESAGKLRVQYRMSADMFMSNLELEIKSGRFDASIKQLPVNEIIARYFQKHLQLESNNTAFSAESVTFTLDAKSGDWIAEFAFPAPPPGAEPRIFCDAFLENNPRTLTLAHIDWRGEKTVFHFRKDNERYKLGSSFQSEAAAARPVVSESVRFVDGLASGLRSYMWLAAGALVLCALRLLLGNRWILIVPPGAVVLSIAFSGFVATDAAGQWGFRLGWIAVALTLQKLFFDIVNERPTHA